MLLELEIEPSREGLRRAFGEVRNFLAPYESRPEWKLLELGIQEMIRNGYEHGSLELSGDEKVALLESGIFEQTVEERSALAVAQRRFIRVVIVAEPENLSVVVSDPGKGFDHRATSPVSATRSKCSEALAGRGLALVRSAFTEVKWNELGNTISAVRVWGT